MDRVARRAIWEIAMRSSVRFSLAAFVPLLCALLLAESATAQSAPQSVEEYFRGKQASMIIYTPAGGTYDIYARLLIRYLPDHLPGNPRFIPKNVTGAGGLTAARFLYVSAPKDGLTIGTIGRGLPFEPLLGGVQAFDFDPLKFEWLGSMNRESSLAVSWHTAAVKTAKDLLSKELLIAATSADSDSKIIPNAMNGLVGTKFKIVTGYSGMTNAALAVERGEAEGLGYWGWVAVKSEKPNWLAEKKINLLFQTALTPHPEIPNVPLAMSLAHNEDERECLELLLARDVLGRPFVAPPGTPADRVAALRAGFFETLADPALLAEADKIHIEVNPVTGTEITDLLRRVLTYPNSVVERTKVAMGR
jgi:tripartite-type tricarboxylate transporter receptor subunit TctC